VLAGGIIIEPGHDPLLGGSWLGGGEVLGKGVQLHKGRLGSATLLCLPCLLLIQRHIACEASEKGVLSGML